MVPEELQREVAGYYGTYVLDPKKRIVTHHVAVSRFRFFTRPNAIEIAINK